MLSDAQLLFSFHHSIAITQLCRHPYARSFPLVPLQTFLRAKLIIISVRLPSLDFVACKRDAIIITQNVLKSSNSVIYSNLKY